MIDPTNEVDRLAEPKEVPPYILRMRDELKDLGERLKSLGAFVHDKDRFGDVSPVLQSLMVDQYHAMQRYHQVLSSRYLLLLQD